jgi:hypothetical protein
VTRSVLVSAILVLSVPTLLVWIAQYVYLRILISRLKQVAPYVWTQLGNPTPGRVFFSRGMGLSLQPQGGLVSFSAWISAESYLTLHDDEIARIGNVYRVIQRVSYGLALALLALFVSAAYWKS